jgi:hypothetical protein
LFLLAFFTVWLVSSRVEAVVYEVNRTFSDGFSTAMLTGTVSVPLGNYVIQNASPSPFTAVNLTLTVNAVPYSLTNALTDVITGTGQFTIDATATDLIFIASGDVANPADLVFSDNLNPNAPNRYSIGSDGIPAFQIAATESEFVSTQMVQFPDVFGVAIPEPAAGLTLLIGMAGMGSLRRSRAG